MVEIPVPNRVSAGKRASLRLEVGDGVGHAKVFLEQVPRHAYQLGILVLVQAQNSKVCE